jgi:hypothetical protein
MASQMISEFLGGVIQVVKPSLLPECGRSA